MGRDFSRSLDQPPAQCRVSFEVIQVLKTQTYEDCINSLGNLLPCFTFLMEKVFFISLSNCSFFSLHLLFLILLLCPNAQGSYSSLQELGAAVRWHQSHPSFLLPSWWPSAELPLSYLPLPGTGVPNLLPLLLLILPPYDANIQEMEKSSSVPSSICGASSKGTSQQS